MHTIFCFSWLDGFKITRDNKTCFLYLEKKADDGAFEFEIGWFFFIKRKFRLQNTTSKSYLLVSFFGKNERQKGEM